MFVCFDVIFDDDLIRRLELEKKKNVYISSYSETVKEIKKSLNDKIKIKIENKLINGKDVQNSWFPALKETKIDVFLSHSHQDIEYVRSFAGWLKKELDVTAFIDSDLWLNIKDLERDLGKDLNEEKYIKGIKFYDYDNTRLMLQHTNNMLVVALQQMIDKAECVFFLNSQESVPINQGKIMNATYSPWIYTEISCTNIIRRKPLVCYRELDTYVEYMLESFAKSKQGEECLNIHIAYPLDFRKFISINAEDLSYWKFEELCTAQREKYPLDALYKKLYPSGWREFGEHIKMGKRNIQRIINTYDN